MAHMNGGTGNQSGSLLWLYVCLVSTFKPGSSWNLINALQRLMGFDFLKRIYDIR